MKEQQDYEAILDSISDGVFTVDEKWCITSFNRAAENITGVSKEEAIGSSCSEVLRSSICGSECALRQTLEDGTPIINRGCYFINSMGEQIPITLSTAVLKNSDGQVIGGAETFRDISEIESLKKQLSAESYTGKIQSNSPEMQSILQLMNLVAPTSSTILIYGDTGTGKEVATRTIHELSCRNKEPFVAVNCAALPENLLESILFGHKKGAFTGAVENQEGLFSRTGKGTLFLDEIGDISQALQVRLLRVLQEHEYESLGGNRTIQTEARIIAATNRNLKQLIKEGAFREDLYYRLNVINFTLPPLRERKDDIPHLSYHFIERFNKIHNKNISGFSSDALSLLIAYSWPGNIRELENVIERSCILCGGDTIRLSDFPEEISGNKKPRIVDKKLLERRENAEKDSILSALKKTGNNKLAAAELLGIHKTTLFRKIKKYGIGK